MSALEIALERLRTGDEANAGRDFGRGVAHALSLIDEALAADSLGPVPLNSWRVTVESAFGVLVPHVIAAQSLPDLWAQLSYTDWKSWLPPDEDEPADALVTKLDQLRHRPSRRR